MPQKSVRSTVQQQIPYLQLLARADDIARQGPASPSRALSALDQLPSQFPLSGVRCSSITSILYARFLLNVLATNRVRRFRSLRL